MAGIQNTIVFSQGQKLQESTAQDIDEMQGLATDVSTINYTGNPEGVISANPSSICHDPVAGVIYLKQTGTGNTGWTALTPGGGGGVTEYFSSYLGSPTAFLTGDNTIVPLVCDGIITNSSSSYNPATGVYTAPSAGQYAFQHTVCFNGGDALTLNYLTLWNGSSYSTRGFQITPVPQSGGDTIIFSAAIFCQLGMGDTMAVSALSGGTNKNVRLYGAAPSSFATTCTFSGQKLA